MRLNKIKEIAAAVNQIGRANNHAILIYGPPKTGKTRFVATAALMDEIDTIYWFDMENGWETILHMDLPDSALAKIELIRIPDVRRNPVALETILRAICGGKPVEICEAHGKCGCAPCKTKGAPTVSFDLSKCTNRDLVVLDSGSQIGNSALSAAMIGKDITAKPTFDDYGMARFWLVDLFSVLQQCVTTNFVMITHELIDEEEFNGKTSDRIFPLVGTRAFCREVSKYFGTVAYRNIKLGQYAIGSSPTYNASASCGSRLGVKLEALKEPTMRDILVAGGVIAPRQVVSK